MLAEQICNCQVCLELACWIAEGLWCVHFFCLLRVCAACSGPLLYMGERGLALQPDSQSFGSQAIRTRGCCLLGGSDALYVRAAAQHPCPTTNQSKTKQAAVAVLLCRL